MQNSESLELPKQLTSLQKSARSITLKCLQRLEVGTLTIVESFTDGSATSRETFGTPREGEPNASIEVRDPHFYARLLKGGSIAAGEAYMDGWWKVQT